MENHFCIASIQILVYENLESGYTEMGWVVVVCNFRSLSNEKTEAVLFCIYLYNYQLVRFQKQSWSLVRLLLWKDISCWYLNSLFKEEIILIFYYIYMYVYISTSSGNGLLTPHLSALTVEIFRLLRCLEASHSSGNSI